MSPPERGSAGAVARAWVEAVMDRQDLDAAWPLTDSDLRVVLVQQWVLANLGDPAVASEDRDTLAEELASCPPEHPLWERFASYRVRRWRRFWAGFSLRTWDVEDGTQPLAEGLEIVTFLEKHRLMGLAAPGPPPVARRFAMRLTGGGWLVAGVDGSALFRPGWPPTQQRLPAPG
jgi:hypothetical protein